MASRSAIVHYLWRNPSLWVAGMLLAPGLFFCMFGVAQAIGDARFASDGARADAIVLSKDVQYKAGLAGNSYWVQYRFTLPSDQTYEVWTTLGVQDWEGLVERGPVTVQYLVSDPSTNRLLVSGTFGAAWAPLDVGAGLSLGGAYLVVRALRKRREDRRLMRLGIEAPATVTAVDPTTFSVNDNTLWVISYVYRDAGGTEHEGRSWMMPEEAARKVRRGGHAMIRYDPDRPDQSFWVHNVQTVATVGSAISHAKRLRRRQTTIDAPARSSTPRRRNSGATEPGGSPPDTSIESRAPDARSAPDEAPAAAIPPTGHGRSGA